MNRVVLFSNLILVKLLTSQGLYSYVTLTKREAAFVWPLVSLCL